MSPADLKFMENPWRGAEAYHFYLLAQRQYYSGNLDAALKSALHLRNYEDIIDVKIVYSLLSIIALTSKHYSTCSKAFIKLEGLSSDAASSEQVETFENIALNIFTR